jgi:hypothetical protein
LRLIRKITGDKIAIACATGLLYRSAPGGKPGGRSMKLYLHNGVRLEVSQEAGGEQKTLTEPTDTRR